MHTINQWCTALNPSGYPYTDCTRTPCPRTLGRRWRTSGPAVQSSSCCSTKASRRSRPRSPSDLPRAGCRRPVGHCVSGRRPQCCGHAHPVRPRCSSLCGDVPVAGADARGIVPAHDTSWLCHRRRWRRCRACTLVPVEGVCVVHRAAQGRRLSSWAWTRAGGRKATISSWFIRSSTAKKSPACDRRVVAPAIDTWKRCSRRKRPGAWLGSWCPGPPRGRFDEVWRCDGWIAVGPQGGRGGDHSIAGIAAGTVGLCARGLRS